MTKEELITKAREHLKPFDRRNSFGVSSHVFPDTRVQEVTLVVFGCKERQDYIDVYVDSQNGAFITATYHPGWAENNREES